MSHLSHFSPPTVFSTIADSRPIQENDGTSGYIDVVSPGSSNKTKSLGTGHGRYEDETAGISVLERDDAKKALSVELKERQERQKTTAKPLKIAEIALTEKEMDMS